MRSSVAAEMFALDPNIRPGPVPHEDTYRRCFDDWLPRVSRLRPSEEDADWSGGEIQGRLAVGPTDVVITKGGDGLTVFTRDGDTFAVLSGTVAIVDTMGAGDTVDAALPHTLAEQGLVAPGAGGSLSIEDRRPLLKFAARAAAVTCSRAGADLRTHPNSRRRRSEHERSRTTAPTSTAAPSEPVPAESCVPVTDGADLPYRPAVVRLAAGLRAPHPAALSQLHRKPGVRTYALGCTVVRMPTDYFAQDPRTNLERMVAGDLYIADDPEIAGRQQQAVRLAARFQATYTEDADAAQPLLVELLGSVGDEVHVRPPLYVDYGSNITIGARTFVNYNLTALDVAAITIGEDCQIGPNVQLLTPTHPLEPQPRRDKLEAAKPITIGDNVWIGGGAIVLPGVTIGDNSVIGAGAVVTKDIPANVVAVGNPARPVRTL